MKRQTIRMVCFDVGGVLVRHCRSWREGCAAAGLPVRDGSDTEEMARRRKELACLLTTGRLTPREFYEQMAAACGGLYTPAEVERIHHAWLGPEYEGVGLVIARLVEAGRAETGVLSNTNEPHWMRLEAADSTEYQTPRLLRHRHASHRLGAMKPAAEAFALFERHTGFRGEEILFLEDLPENAAAAAERGWRVELIDHTRETARQIETVLQRHGLI